MAFTKITAAGIGTTESVTLDGLSVINNGSFGGNLTVGGVLTYEDVTNVDSVGLITARNGIVVGSGITLSKDGDIFATGITTVSGNVKVGTGITLSPDGDIFATGVTTSTSFVGDLTGDVTGDVTGTASGNAVLTGSTNNQLVTVTGSNAITGESTLLFDGTDTLEMGTAAGGSGYDSNMKLRIGRASDAQICVRNTSGDSNYGGLIFGDQSSSFGGGIQYHHNGDSMRFYTGGSSERLRIDAYGRVLIGGTSAIIGSSAEFAEIVLGGRSKGAGITLQDEDSNVRFQIRTDDDASGTLGTLLNASTNHDMFFRTNNTERLRISSSGQVMIGTTTEGNTNADDLTVANSGEGGITIRTGSSSNGNIFFSDATSGAGEYAGIIDYKHSSDAMTFATSGSERYRIHSNGTQSWGNTTFPYNEHYHFYTGISGKAGMSLYFGTDTDEPGFIMRHGRSGANSGAYTGKLFQFRNSSGNENGSIASNASVTAYNTSSDYRLKENELTISDAISKVKRLKPYTFNFKVTPDQKVDGFFAHEAQEVIPYAVLGEKDAEDMQQMDYGKLTPLLTAALQEAITEIESLKAEVAALKSS